MTNELRDRIIALLEFYSEDHNPSKFGGACGCDWCGEHFAVMELLKAEQREQRCKTE